MLLPFLFTAALCQTSPSMPKPWGYSRLVFEDRFPGKTLDSRKWIPAIADQKGIWDNFGALPKPFSAVGNAGHYKAEYGNPSEVVVNDGLTLTARRDTSQKGYDWRGAYICTHGKFLFDHGFAQFRAKMPDSRSGGWGAIWFLEGGEEIDLIETGFTANGIEKANQTVAVDLQTAGNEQIMFDAKVDLSADFHTYGMEYLPGKSIAMFFDGKQMVRYTSNIPTGAYTIIITNTVAQKAGAWHTLPGPQTPPVLTTKVAEVQVWQ